jgi:hypothetical protein
MPRRRRSFPSTISRLLVDVVTLAGFAVTSRSQLAAENVFFRKQLALYQERRVKPRRPDPVMSGNPADGSTRVVPAAFDL